MLHSGWGRFGNYWKQNYHCNLQTPLLNANLCRWKGSGKKTNRISAEEDERITKQQRTLRGSRVFLENLESPGRRDLSAIHCTTTTTTTIPTSMNHGDLHLPVTHILNLRRIMKSLISLQWLICKHIQQNFQKFLIKINGKTQIVDGMMNTTCPNNGN